MKKITYTLILIIMVVSATSCSIKQKNTTFTATILENNTSYLLIEPLETTDEIKASDTIVVYIKDTLLLDSNENKINESKMSSDEKVEITYDGVISESYPAQINKCYKVKTLN